MKKTLRLISLLLAIVMLGASFVACGDEQEDETQNTAINETTDAVITEEAIPNVPKNDYGAEFFLRIMPDSNSVTGHFVEESNNDVLTDAVYARQEKVREYLGVEIVGSETEGSYSIYADNFKTAVKNRDGSIDMLLTHVYEGLPSLISENYLADISTLPGVDLDADYWNQEFMEDLSISDKYYLGYSDFNILFTHVITYNKTLLDQYADSLEKSVYDMVRSKEWTFDQMISLANLVYIDVTADGKTPDDTFGITGRLNIEFPGFLHAAGIKIIEQNESGEYKVALMNDIYKEKTTALVDKLQNLVKSDCSYFNDANATASTVPLTTGRTLMYLQSSLSLSSNLDYEISFGVLPYPLWDSNQDSYHHLQWSGYTAIPSYTSNPQMVGETLEALSYFSDDVKIAYYEKMLGKQVADVPDDSAMLAIVWDTVCCEFAQTYAKTVGGTGLLYLLPTVAAANSSANLASSVAGYARSANTAISKFYKKMK